MREDLARLETEKRNMNTIDIDVVPTAEVLKMINDEDKTVAPFLAFAKPFCRLYHIVPSVIQFDFLALDRM